MSDMPVSMLLGSAAEPPDFQAIFETGPHLFVVFDRDICIVAASDAWCRATLVEREAILGRHLFEVFPENDGGNLRESLRRVIELGQPDTVAALKYDIPRPDGSIEERWWSPVNTPIFGPDGSVLWVLNQVEDITDVVRMQSLGESSKETINQLTAANTALAQRNDEIARLHREMQAQADYFRESTASLELIVDNIPAMVVIKDARDLSFVRGNKAGDTLTGYSMTDTIGMTDFDLFPREQAEAFVRFDREVLASGELRVVPEEVISTRSNGDRILRTYKMPVLDADGRPKYLLAMSEDITEQKQAEAARRASEAMFRSLLSASPDAVMAIGAEGRILLANERFRSMYGYGPEELIGQPASMLTPQDRREDNSERSRAALAGAHGGVASVQNLEGLRRDGTVFPVEATLSDHETANGRMVIIALRDVTERKAVEDQLRQAQKMEAIGNLTGGLAHDFNNLLSIVIGNLDLLREEIADQAGANELAGEALSAALRGAELTKRLLAFARRQPLQPKLTDVNDLVTGISKLLARTMGDNFAIRHRLGESVWPVTVDQAQLENCLVNLAANARDAMPRGGELTLVTDNRHLDEDYVSLHPGLAAGDYTLIEVSDTGTGIPKEMLDKIFEPFFTTKKEGRGTGLGLSMVFGFMKQSEGHINVYSEVGVGTSFRLYLPRAEGAVGSQDAAHGVPVAGGRETVLAVEDNPGLRALVVKQLTALGYRCLEAENGPEALKVLEAEPVDLLFTDVVMPGGMSGYELGREAKTRWRAIRVLLTSGFPEEKLNGNGQPPWNMRLLTKPYRKEDLARILREVLAE